MNGPSLEARLEASFAERKLRNPRYSLRAFARDIGLSHGFVSLICEDGKFLPFHKSSLCTTLKIEEPERSAILLNLEGERRVKREMGDLTAAELSPNTFPLELEKFYCVADWYHGAIVELIVTERFSGRLSLDSPAAEYSSERSPFGDKTLDPRGRDKKMGTGLEAHAESFFNSSLYRG